MFCILVKFLYVIDLHSVSQFPCFVFYFVELSLFVCSVEFTSALVSHQVLIFRSPHLILVRYFTPSVYILLVVVFSLPDRCALFLSQTVCWFFLLSDIWIYIFTALLNFWLNFFCSAVPALKFSQFSICFAPACWLQLGPPLSWILTSMHVDIAKQPNCISLIELTISFTLCKVAQTV